MAKAVFITRKIPDIGIRMLKERGYEVDVNLKDSVLSQKQIIKSLKKKTYDAVLVLLTDRVDSAIFNVAPSVKIYANCAAGYDNIDIIEAKKRGITVTNAPAPLATEAVAEHVIALMFALATRIVEADKFVRRGKYKKWLPMNFMGINLAGKTLGLIGAGRIGERVARLASGLGLKVIYYDVIRNERIEKECGVAYYNSIEELLQKADVVSLHVPLLDSTRHLINEKRLLLMKPTSFLVNTSRGPVVDEKALEKALRKKIIRGAALDVFEFEPKVTPGLKKMDNVVLTPHIASAEGEARNQMAEIAAQNIIDFFENGKPGNIVNP
ncbi:hypothetical protein A3I25_00840 [Candidatus Nomurabacteria bacterium RIFCSPLOWO2_02_FULL_42_17]|uniref:D-glycerate dehydrogenase n=2 Tax=Candidatus Nomuraibacteriota TaxID=1752729 RepID=A0A1F6WJN7_9BACT|nr:MAG: hypothetical protein A3B93_02455 [Candidatus Nomurabacteria bacterium RIFCSPHIGHO2_02_FULL_42_24]OGI96455.1 MAG: hypothetical protein A3I25_00840 [Candidatus Nomurabacteria bacterium RIFCSPLOWO2_02_FULL_42_17]